MLAMKGTETKQTNSEARFVVQALRDSDKGVLIHTSSTVRASSIRLLVTVTWARRMQLWAFDVTQTCLQSDKECAREEYIEPPRSSVWGRGSCSAS